MNNYPGNWPKSIDPQEVMDQATREQERLFRSQEDRIRALIQEEIRLAFGVVKDEANEMWRSAYTDSAESAAAAVLRDVMDSVLGKPTGPVPISPDAWCTECPHRYGDHRCEERHTFVGKTEDDPFALKSADHYATEIRNLISRAEADGHPVWLGSHCEGTGHSLNVGNKSTGTAAPCVWEEQ